MLQHVASSNRYLVEVYSKKVDHRVDDHDPPIHSEKLLPRFERTKLKSCYKDHSQTDENNPEGIGGGPEGHPDHGEDHHPDPPGGEKFQAQFLEMFQQGKFQFRLFNVCKVYFSYY